MGKRIQPSFYLFILLAAIHIFTLNASAQEDQSTDGSMMDHKQGISMNFQSIPVRQALQIIAEHSQFNLVVADSVEGDLSLRLDDVPWTQALDIILQLKNLEKHVDSNVIMITPSQELIHNIESKQEVHQTVQAGDLVTELIAIQFAKASDIANMIAGEGNKRMLSEMGNVSIDERTNALLIRELPEELLVIKQMIEALDIPVKQVQIEARIVTINEGNSESLGVRWGSRHSTNGKTIGGSIEGNLSSDLAVDNYLNVNLGVVNPSASRIAFQVAKLGADSLLDLELSALQAESKAEIISSPRLVTTNKQPAYIEQGTEIPYLEAASSGATSVSFKKAVLSLKVTPQITPDNRLILDLDVTQDSPGEVVKAGDGEAVAVDTQRISTQVLVNNGETIVLGGIYQYRVFNSTEKVPLLGDIPLLGRLFKRTSENLAKSELLIFVTPKVIL